MGPTNPKGQMDRSTDIVEGNTFAAFLLQVNVAKIHTPFESEPMVKYISK
jgi:hypothetical protein